MGSNWFRRIIFEREDGSTMELPGSVMTDLYIRQLNTLDDLMEVNLTFVVRRGVAREWGADDLSKPPTQQKLTAEDMESA